MPGQPAENPKRIAVWAIDPFEGDLRPPAHWLREFMAAVGRGNWEIYPTHVLSTSKDVEEDDADRVSVERAVLAAQKAGEKFMSEFEKPRGVVHPVTVLHADSDARGAEARRLLEFVEQVGAECVVVSSHGRSGLRRLVLGSFAENLLRHSKRPVVFTAQRPDVPVSAAGRTRVLFATDFSDQSREAFFQFLPEARRLDWEIVVFHSVSFPAVAHSMNSPFVLPKEYFPEQMLWAQDEVARWAMLAQARGVCAHGIVRDSGLDLHTADSILTATAAVGAQWIALASVSGTLASWAAGSVAREVCRANRYPVWVYGPEALAARVVA